MAPLTSSRHLSPQLDDSDCQSQNSFESLSTYETMLTAQDDSYLNDGTNTRVQFLPLVYAETVLNRNDYTDEEVQACWYTPREKEKLCSRLQSTVERMESGKPPRRGQTYRGLEFHSAEGAQALRDTITTCIDAVMDEQERQWLHGLDDYDRLAMISLQTSRRSKELAYETGQSDSLRALCDDAEHVFSSANNLAVKEVKQKVRGSRKRNARADTSLVGFKQVSGSAKPLEAHNANNARSYLSSLRRAH